MQPTTKHHPAGWEIQNNESAGTRWLRHNVLIETSNDK